MKYLLTLLVIGLVACDDKDRLTFTVGCDHCRVRYSVGDSIVTRDVTNGFVTRYRVQHDELYGIHVDSISGQQSAYAMVRIGDDTEYIETCLSMDACRLSYIGKVSLPWYAR